MRACVASIGIAVALLGMAAGSPALLADEPQPTPTPAPALVPTPAPVTIQLRDGRVYHQARVMDVEADSLVLNTQEGLIKVPRSNLSQSTLDALHVAPADSAGGDMVMPSYNLSAVQVSPTPQAPARPTPKPRATPAPKPTPNPVYKGCTIVSFTPKAFGTVLGTAEVVIRNDTDIPVVLYPNDLTAVLTSGAQLRGRKFVVEQSYPPVIRRRETVQPHNTLQDQVTFSDEGLDLAGVRWTR